MNYLEYFRLNDDPFRMTPDSIYFYPSREHNEILASLQYAIEQKEGFSLVVGEPGTGKTTILRILVDHWKEKADIALIMTPHLSPEEFLQAVLEDIRVDLKGLNKNEMLKAFRDILLEHSKSEKRVIIIVDEAQNLPDDTLEELRLLSNLETEKEKLLQIMLVGQPELKGRLEANHLKQLNQRITIRATLKPLTKEETCDYLNFRLIKAGKGSLVLADGAKQAIYAYSKGIPRLINLVTSRAIMAAFVAGSGEVKRNHVVSAIRHLNDDMPPRRFFATAFCGIALVAIVIAVSLWIVKLPGGGSKDHDHTRNSALLRENRAAGGLVSEKIVTVVTSTANLRGGPSMEAQKVASAAKGSSFAVLSERLDKTGKVWFKVGSFEDEDRWVSEKVVKMKRTEVMDYDR